MSCIQCNSLLSPLHSGHTQAPYHVSLASIVGDNYEINVLNLKNTFQNLGGNRQGRGPLTHVTGEVITEQTVLPGLSFALLTDILGSVWFPSQIASFCGARYTLISPLQPLSSLQHLIKGGLNKVSENTGPAWISSPSQTSHFVQ